MKYHAALAAALSLAACQGYTQESAIDAALERSRSGGAARAAEAQASAQPPATSDKHDLAIFYHRRGMARSRLGNYPGALEDLQVALDYNQPNRLTPDGWGERWRIQNDLLNTLEHRGDWFGHIAVLHRLAQEWRESNLFRYHFVQLRLMNAHSVLGQWPEAEKARAESEEMLARLRGTRDWGWDRFNALDLHNKYMGYHFNRQGNHAEAERRFRISLESAENWHEERLARQGKDHQTVRIARGNIESSKKDLADNLATQGKYGEAEALARSALEDALALHGFNTVQVSYALQVLAWTKFQQGDLAAAERYRRHALAAALGSGMAPHSTALAGRRAGLANTYVAQSRWRDALALFEERDRDLRSNPAQFKRVGSRHVSWAYALHKTGQHERAQAMLERLVNAALKRPVPDRWALALRRGVLAMALGAGGRTLEALQAYRESVPDLVRRDHDDTAAEDTGYWRAFWQRAVLEGYLELLGRMQAQGSAPAGLDVADESFRLADIARGSSVQQAITATAARAQLPDSNLAALARRDQDTLRHIQALHRALARLAEAPEPQRLHKVIGDMQGDIARLRKEHAALRAEIFQRFPEYADLVDPVPVGIDGVRRALGPREALVSIYLGEAQAYVWTMTKHGRPSFRVVNLPRVEVERDVAALRRATDFADGSLAQLPAFDLARSRKLYAALLAPDEALWSNATVLNVIPHGALGQLPFATLVTAAAEQPAAGPQAAYRDVPWLARRIALAQLPSANAFAALRRAPPIKEAREAFIGFGDPLFGKDAAGGERRAVLRNLALNKQADRREERLEALLQAPKPAAAAAPSAAPGIAQSFAVLAALPDTSDELREIAATLKADAARDVFLRDRATEKNVKAAQLHNRRVVAFATHGIAPGELTGLDQPALALSNPALTGDSDNDGFLTMEEVLGLKLAADWVVLSACNTAAADGRASEAVSGLGRAFFYAGASSLLVSNWAVESSSAKYLTTALFRAQAEDPRLTRAGALRQSMLSLMQRESEAGAGEVSFSYAHPVFWAPFALVGDGGAD